MSETHDDPVDRAVTYMTSLEPTIDVHRGASPESLAALERALGRPPSAPHRRFLEHFGAPGGMKVDPLDLDADALVGAYESTEGSLPAEYELFGVSQEDPYLDLFLHHTEGREPRVVAMHSVIGGDFGRIPAAHAQVVSGALSEWLCLPVFVRVRYQPRPFKATLAHAGPRDDAWPRFQAMVDENEMRLAWFSSDITKIVETGDSVIVAKRLPGAPLAVAVASSSRTEFAAIRWWLTRDVGLELRAVV
ncbi:hypothetical protein [Sorangium sp. So ce131]|uniref:hypothetical protein n=1 Tax=Sorangium sp. So ce131 TaxID=3133282 RepID=UPI003F60F427